MIGRNFWNKVPSAPIVDALPLLTWQPINGDSPASATAALMLYVALIFTTDTVNGTPTTMADLPYEIRTPQISYEDLAGMTGISRKLIASGLRRLTSLNLIKAEGSSQRRSYIIIGGDQAWFKLPCQAITAKGVIKPFSAFTLRSKIELHALKIYLYLAARRDRQEQHTSVSYENIYLRIGVPERDIKRAVSLLINTGILRGVTRDPVTETTAYGPNKYFLSGSEKLSASAK